MSIFDRFKSGLSFQGRMASWAAAGVVFAGWYYYDSQSKQKKHQQAEIFDTKNINRHNRLIKKKTKHLMDENEKTRKD